jgi:hypothetical protein
VLAIDGLIPEKVRLTRFCDVTSEFGVSVLEGEELRVLNSGVGQAAKTAVAIPTRMCGGSDDCRVKCRENCEKQKGLAEHVEGRHLADWRMRGRG